MWTNSARTFAISGAPYNNALIRSGEAPGTGWSRNMLYSGFNILPRSVFWSASCNGRSDNADVIPLVPMTYKQFSLQALFGLITVTCIFVCLYLVLAPKQVKTFTPEGYNLKARNKLPQCSVFWFRDSENEIVSGFVAFGDHEQIMVSSFHGDINIPSLGGESRIPIPQDGTLYVLDPSLTLHKTEVDVAKIVAKWRDYDDWASEFGDEIKKHAWQ